MIEREPDWFDEYEREEARRERYERRALAGLDQADQDWEDYKACVSEWSDHRY